MEPSELLRVMAGKLEQLGIPYLVTGSMASIAYGEPRLTNDIDVVADLRPGQVDAFCAAFPDPEFYCPRDYVADAVRKKFQFNVLHPESGLKIDVIIATDSAFDRARLSRAVRLQEGADFAAWFASPEDVILKKLEYYREGGSEKHVRDILGVLKIRGDRVDRAYIAEWANRMGLKEQWDLVLARLSASDQVGD
ncbi:MAG TPA: hypothetical protein VKD90_16700 [Gemmataceae bacterium]|nr:hypothetical protein [Gemmataceae bacterium]